MAELSSTTHLVVRAGAWSLDPTTTTIEIHAKAMWGMTKVNGVFRAVSGTGVVGDHGAITGELVVDAKSIDTKNKKRDEHLRSADFFDSSNYPTFTFTASEVTPTADGKLNIRGALVIKDQSRSIVLVAKSTSVAPDRMTVDAETIIDRSNWGMSWAKMGAGLTNRVVVVAQFVRS